MVKIQKASSCVGAGVYVDYHIARLMCMCCTSSDHAEADVIHAGSDLVLKEPSLFDVTDSSFDVSHNDGSKSPDQVWPAGFDGGGTAKASAQAEGGGSIEEECNGDEQNVENGRWHHAGV